MRTKKLAEMGTSDNLIQQLQNLEYFVVMIGDADIGDDESVVEGRIALFQLEKQLKDYRLRDAPDNHTNASSSIGSKQASLQSERKILDQIPRDERLSNRLDSPLGMNVEEMGDRGFLDGGALVPSYHTSMKQKNRRALELKKRSSRLLRREEKVRCT